MLTHLVPIESFLDPMQTHEIWPSDITNNKAFARQLHERRELNERLEIVLRSLPRPDISLETAVEFKYIEEDQVAELYVSLSVMLESRDYIRLVLYLPFEFLPSKTWHSSNRKLQDAIDHFRHAYMKAWQSLLSFHDVRANFIDGDVLEVERRLEDLPRVVKAAHLIPKLVEKGLMEAEDAMTLLEESDDPTLQSSITDALSVLEDAGIPERGVQTRNPGITLPYVRDTLRKTFSRIDGKRFDGITKKREAWLRSKEKQEAIEAMGEKIRLALMTGKIVEKTIKGFLSSRATLESQHAWIEGIRGAIESYALISPDRARALYAQHRKGLLTLWEINDPGTRDLLSKAFRRFHKLGVIDDIQLLQLRIPTPTLEGPFSKNLELIEMHNIEEKIRFIESHPELSKLLYPVVMVYGSRLKGYGTQGADVDLGVFVRPGVPLHERTRIRELLQGEFIEFWLREKDGFLFVRDLETPDPLMGMGYWTHILFGAAWMGSKGLVLKLQKALLVPYLYNTDKLIHGRNARSLYLEELERDTLQYRLMHKGYELFFPQYGGIHTRHADRIDGKSMFWDSGYRQLATKLFIRRVFLPKIPLYES